MPRTRRNAPPAFPLLAIGVVAATLRFARLGSKPLWLDEAMTTLVSFGRGPADVPVGREIALVSLKEIFTVRAGSSVTTVIARLRDPLVQHTHPPLFHLLLRGWLAVTNPSFAWLALDARLLAAALGVVAVFVVFAAARTATSGRGAVLAAALTAVSPLMVMISREARNYTLPLVCVAAATWAMAAIANALDGRRPVPAGVWVAFTAANVAGCYAHYFVLVWFAAEVAVLAWMAVRRRASGALAALTASAAMVALAFAPWLPTFAAHAQSPEQGWMRDTNPVMYVYHTLSAWQAMIQGWKFDVYSPQAAWKAVRVAIGLAVLSFVAVRLVRTTRARDTTAAFRALGAAAALTIVMLWVASLVQQKDLLSEYRYHFVYYPALIVVVAAALAPARTWIVGAVVALGLAHSVFLVEGWEFPQLTRPAEVAAVIATATEAPTLLAVGEASFHETVNAITFVLASPHEAFASADVVFVRRGDAYPTFAWRDVDPSIFWSRITDVRIARTPRTAWVWSASMLPNDYRPSFRLLVGEGLAACTLDAREIGRTIDDDDPPRGPFRRYRCL